MQSTHSASFTGRFVSPLPPTFAQTPHRPPTAPKPTPQCGSCAVFASFAAIEASYLAVRNDTAPTQLDLSEQEVLDCTSGNICAYGYWPKDVLNM